MNPFEEKCIFIFSRNCLFSCSWKREVSRLHSLRDFTLEQEFQLSESQERSTNPQPLRGGETEAFPHQTERQLCEAWQQPLLPLSGIKGHFKIFSPPICKNQTQVTSLKGKVPAAYSLLSTPVQISEDAEVGELLQEEPWY